MAKPKMDFSTFKINTNISGSYNVINDNEKKEVKDFIESAPITPAFEKETQESAIKNDEKIQSLFPSKLNLDIPLEQLDPAPDEWNFFNKPDIETFKLIVKSIYYQGQLAPALVWKQPNERYMILGGHTRYTALKFLKETYGEDRFNTLNCHVYEENQIDTSTAQFIIITNNMTQRAKEAPSIQIKSIVHAVNLQKAIKKEHWGELEGRSIDIVAKSFGIGKGSANRFYQMRNLIHPFINLLDMGTLKQSTALKLCLLSPEIQHYIADNELFDSLKDEKLNQLRTAKTVDEAVEIITAPEKYSFGGVKLDYSVPKSFRKINLAMDEEDITAVKDSFLQALNTIQFKNEKSKKLLVDLLNGI